MKEYIVSVEDDDHNFAKVFIAYIREQKELIRCRNCLWYEFDKPHTCGYIGIEGHIDEYDYCSRAETKPEGDQE